MKIKKCPFCGGEARIMLEEEDRPDDSFHNVYCTVCGAQFWVKSKTEAVAAWNRRDQPEITGETSDGYHTFNELYHHRAVLFSVICNAHPEMAWKSKLHHDGTMYDGMFIVGIQTPEGQATYHYDIDPYWEMFNVQELPQAPEWDGHTPAQAIERIGKLNTQPENSRQHALQTGVCPMCEDCPDGCPIETPKDSRNIVTNADRVRSMNDEELAKTLADVDDDFFYEEICGSDERTRVCDNDCVACTLEWLRQPAKEEHYETD